MYFFCDWVNFKIRNLVRERVWENVYFLINSKESAHPKDTLKCIW